jgi:hypothetical protein
MFTLYTKIICNILKSINNMLRITKFKSLFRALYSLPSTKIKYPLINRSFENFYVKFENVNRVLTKKGHTTITRDAVCFTMDTYETKNNEPNVLTMIVRTKPTYDSKTSFDDTNNSIGIEINENNFKQMENGPCMICREEVKMVDTTKYTSFYVNENKK